MYCVNPGKVHAWALVVGLSLLSGQCVLSAEANEPRLVMLAPGTPVDGALPTHWSERVVRSVPRLASGKLATLPSSAKTSATLLRTTILADVVPGRGGYRLRAVGVGNAVPFGGREVVVTPEGPDDARASLSTIETIVCQRAYDELARGRLVAGTSTFALLRTPARLVVRGRHEEVDLNYAIFLDPASGSVRTLNWATFPGKTRPPSRITLLPPDDTFDCALDVAVTRKVGPWSVAWSFAMAALPSGRTIPVPSDVARLVEQNADGNGDAAVVESALRRLMDSPSKG